LDFVNLFTYLSGMLRGCGWVGKGPTSSSFNKEDVRATRLEGEGMDSGEDGGGLLRMEGVTPVREYVGEIGERGDVTGGEERRPCIEGERGGASTG